MRKLIGGTHSHLGKEQTSVNPLRQATFRKNQHNSDLTFRSNNGILQHKHQHLLYHLYWEQTNVEGGTQHWAIKQCQYGTMITFLSVIILKLWTFFTCRSKISNSQSVYTFCWLAYQSTDPSLLISFAYIFSKKKKLV